MRRTAQPGGAIASAAAMVGLVCCGAGPKVSPWPEDANLGTMLRPSSVDAHLARIDDEMGAESMALTEESKGTFQDGEPYVIRAYRGLDPMGNERDAVRVATRFGVVMALGPSSATEALRGIRTQLVRGLGDSEQWQSGSDLNGDGMPDVIVRVGGELQIWGLHARGASPYSILMTTSPTRAVDVDADGRPELVGEVGSGAEALAPTWLEVASFANGAYSADTAVVRAAHARWLRGMTEEPPQQGASRAERMERSLEVAWHAVRSGAKWEPTLARLRRDKELVGEGTLSEEASWSRWAQRLESFQGSGSQAESK